MQWKMTAAMSGIGLVATWMASVPPPAPRVPIAPAPVATPAVIVVTPVEAEAARLARGIAFEAQLGVSSRNPFRFGAATSAPVAAGPAAGTAVPLVASAPASAVALALAGIATDVVEGVEVRTAILSGPAGVQLARVGDTVAGYRVAAIGPDAVELDGPDAAAITLRLTP